MGRKRGRCSEIPGLVLVLLLVITASSVSSEKDRSVIVKRFDARIAEQKGAVDSIRVDLERGRSRVQELSLVEDSYLEQLGQLEKNIEISRFFLQGLSLRIDTVEAHIGLLHDSLRVANEALVTRRQKMKKRLREIYKTGRPGIAELILTSGSITEALSRLKYFQELNRYDRSLLRSIDSTRAKVSEHTRVLEIEQEQLRSLLAEKEAENLELVSEQDSRKTLLEDVQSEKKAYVSMVRELERAQAELNMLLQTLENRRRKAEAEYERGRKVAFEKRKGGLSWPVEGSVIRQYGRIVHPVYETVTMSNGIDIRAQHGREVLCVAPGEVEYVGWMRGYGKFVIVNHFGGYLTVYAHLDGVAVDEHQEIDYGARIGTVGETGSLNGTKLHFQIRQSTETLDPMQWLENRE